jgi:zinc D-Ala-D-Ala dipeptidase
MKWLIDCADVAIPAQPDRPPLQSPPPRSMADNVAVKDDGEPLVPLTGIKVYPVYSWLGFQHCPEVIRLRAGVVERLRRASGRLPTDFEIVVIDGHRTRAFQAELLTFYQAQVQGSLHGFVANPSSKTLIPGHATGGAVDLTLGWRGAVLGLGTDFDSFLPESAPDGLEHRANGSARDLRRLLASVLLAEDMAVNECEWWHWSYGDQHWAYQTSASVAPYDEITLDQPVSLDLRLLLISILGQARSPVDDNCKADDGNSARCS